MVRKLAGTLATVGMLSSPLAFALGLGEAELLSSLNQPFKAKIQLAQAQGVPAEDIRVALADEKAFARAGLDRQQFLQNLSFSVRSQNGQPYIDLSSAAPVKEPFLNFLLQVEWPEGQLMREYTFLIDPPTFNNTLTQQYAQTSQAAPRLAAPAATRQVEEGARRIKIGPTDTLWSLARKNRPDTRVTIKQAMLAIQDANPDAFPTGNINNMEAGSTILIPSRAAMTDRSAASAAREVARQNKAWVASRAQAVKAPQTATKAPDPSLSLVAENSGSDDTAAVREELALSKESLAQSDREKAELSSRLDELQKQVNTLQKLIRLKDEQLAAMEAMLDKQNQLLAGKSAGDTDAAPDAAAEKPAAAPEQAAAPEETTATDIAPTEPPKATTAAAATGGKAMPGAIALDLAGEADKQAAETEQPAEAEAGTEPEPAEPVASFSLDKQESQELDTSSFLMDTLKNNMLLIGGGAAGILSLVLLMMIMRRRRNAADSKQSESGSDNADLMAGAAGGAAGMAALDAVSDDDLPDDLSLDDDLSGDLDLDDNLSDDLSLDDELSADTSLDLDDLGDADATAVKASEEIEDLGDFDLGDLGGDLGGDLETGSETAASDDELSLDDELNLDDLDFSEDFDLGDLEDDKESDDPFAQAELTEDTVSGKDDDAGESVQDNLNDPEDSADNTVLPEQDADDELAAIDFPQPEAVDSEPETELTFAEPKVEGMLSLDDLDTLSVSDDEPQAMPETELTLDDLAGDTDSADMVDLTGSGLDVPEVATEPLPEIDDLSELNSELSAVSDDSTSDTDPQSTSDEDTEDDGLIDLTGEDLSDLDLLVEDTAEEAPESDEDDDLLALLADEAIADEAAEAEAVAAPDADTDEDAGVVDLSDLDITDLSHDLSEEPVQEHSEEQDLASLTAGDPVERVLSEARDFRDAGQPEHAAATLQRALNDYPQDNRLRLDFMDVLVELGDEATFDHELLQLQNSGSAKELTEAMALQQELYRQMGSDSSDATVAGSDQQISPSVSDQDDDILDLNSELDALGRDFDRYADEGPQVTEADAEPGPEMEDLGTLDYELTDLEDMADDEDDEPLIRLDESSETPEPLELDDYALGDDFDQSLLDEAVAAASDENPEYAFDNDGEALRSDTKEYIEDLGDLSMAAQKDSDLELSDMETLMGQDLMDDEPVDLSPDIDSDDELSDLGDLSDISFEQGADDNLDSLNVDGLLDENEDPEIKLDLARAYVEMGNTASAIEALQDVLKRGTADQKEEAAALAAKLQGE